MLKALFCLTTTLSLYMSFWILIFPSTWLIGNNSYHDYVLDQVMDLPHQISGNGDAFPRSMLLKYSRQWSVQFLHTLPAFGWSFLIPLQIYPASRSAFHRTAGYLFAMFSMLMMAGLYMIFTKRLLFIYTDFPNIPAHAHMSALGFDFVPHEPLMLLAGMWFTVTILAAVYFARRKQYSKHRCFIYRHIASGMWVAVQRLYYSVVSPRGDSHQKEVFSDGIIVGLLICLCLGEIAVLATNRIDLFQSKDIGVKSKSS